MMRPTWVYKGGESKIICKSDDDDANKAELDKYTKDGWTDSPAKVKAKPGPKPKTKAE